MDEEPVKSPIRKLVNNLFCDFSGHPHMCLHIQPWKTVTNNLIIWQSLSISQQAHGTAKFWTNLINPFTPCEMCQLQILYTEDLQKCSTKLQNDFTVVKKIFCKVTKIFCNVSKMFCKVTKLFWKITKLFCKVTKRNSVIFLFSQSFFFFA